MVARFNPDNLVTELNLLDYGASAEQPKYLLKRIFGSNATGLQGKCSSMPTLVLSFLGLLKCLSRLYKETNELILIQTGLYTCLAALSIRSTIMIYLLAEYTFETA